MEQGKRKLALTIFFWSVALGAAAPAGSSAAAELPEPSDGGTLLIRKCFQRDGGVRFQSAPCPVGSAQAWTRSEPISPAATAITGREARASGPGIAAVRGGYRVRVANTNTSSRRGRCESARAKATRRRDREWNRLKFDDLSRLDAWVAERCR